MLLDSLRGLWVIADPARAAPGVDYPPELTIQRASTSNTALRIAPCEELEDGSARQPGVDLFGPLPSSGKSQSPLLVKSQDLNAQPQIVGGQYHLLAQSACSTSSQ